MSAILLGLLLLYTDRASMQNPMSGPAWISWDTPAGLGLGAPDLVPPVLLSALPDGFNNRLAGRVTDTVSILASIEKDGTVTPVQFVYGASSRDRNGPEQRAWELVKTWTFQPGTVKGKAMKVGVVLGIPVREGGPVPASSIKSLPAGFPPDLAKADDPNIVPPVRLMYWAPPYLSSLLQRHVDGRIEVTLEVRSDGRVGAAVVTKPLDREADAVALSVARSTLFLPALHDGKPIGAALVWDAAYHLR